MSTVRVIIMVEKWYKLLLDKIEEIKANIILVQDNKGFFNSEEFLVKAKEIYGKIHYFSSEMTLRGIIRDTKNNLLIIYQENNYLPSEVMNKYPVVKLDYNDIFPLFDTGAISWLNVDELQELNHLYQNNLNRFDQLSYFETLDFVLRNLYDTDIDFSNKEQLTGFLIRYYFANDKIQGAIQSLIMEKAEENNLKLNEIDNKKRFFSWLNQEWRKYLLKRNSSINFNSRKIKFLLNDCFEQGLMERVDLLKEEYYSEFIIKETRKNYWINSGIKNLDKVSIKDSFHNEYQLLKELLNKDLEPHEWGNVARSWGHLLYIKNTYHIDFTLSDIELIIDRQFTDFIVNSYDDLAYDQRFYYAPLNNRILTEITRKNERFVLICFDGMSFKEWPAVKEYLINTLSVDFKEGITCSMIPTVTSYSRRAIFSGILPLEDNEQGNEEKAFKQFLLEKSGFKEEEIYFERKRIPGKLDLLGYRSAGLIFNFIDDLSHGAMNQKLLIKNIKDQLEESKLAQTVKYLLNYNYKIYFCSDHGNLFCEGNGFNPKRQLVEDKAARAVLYGTKNLAENENFRNKLVLQLPNILGEKYLVTMSDRTKFGNREPGFTHGGINIEEVIVPFIEVI